MGLLRFVLAVSVLIAHSSPVFGVTIIGGRMSVQAFYIISGFYMSLVLNEKYIGENASYKLFISNRFLRLYPIYWCVLILTVLFCFGAYFIPHVYAPNTLNLFIDNFSNMNFLTFAFLFFINVFIFGQDISFFTGMDQWGSMFFSSNLINENPHLYSFIFIPQGWSIALELMFYLIAPFILRKKLNIIIPVILISLVIRIVIFNNAGLNHDPWNGRFFPAELMFFLLGSISYNVYKKIKNFEIPRFFLLGVLCSLIIITIFYFKLPFNKPYLYIIYFFIALPFIFIYTKNSKIDSYIGELSYPIYISHIFILLIMQTTNIPLIESQGTTLLIGTILLSVMLNKLVANRIEIIRQKRVLPVS